MVELQASEEPISSEELVELGIELDKVKKNAEEAYKILKVLEKTKISASQLKDTMIGKRLTAVKEDFPDD